MGTGTGAGTWDSSAGTCTGTWMTEYWLQLCCTVRKRLWLLSILLSPPVQNKITISLIRSLFCIFGRNSAVPVILYAYAKFEQCGITNRNQGFFVHILKEIALPMSDRSERPRRRRCKHWSIGFASRHHCASYLIHTLFQKNHTILFAL